LVGIGRVDRRLARAPALQQLGQPEVEDLGLAAVGV